MHCMSRANVCCIFLWAVCVLGISLPYPKGARLERGAGQVSKESGVRIFDRGTLAEMRGKAPAAPRGRFGKLLHREFYERLGAQDVDVKAAQDVQRFLNVLAHNSYVMPHMHPEAGKWEVFTYVDGAFEVAAFDPKMPSNSTSNVLESAHLSPEVPLVFVNEGTWHSIAALEDNGGAEFEFKPGPYGGVEKDKIFAYQLDSPWAYDETDSASADAISAYTTKLERAVGTRASDPSDPAAFSLLRPYPRDELLKMLLPSGERFFNLANNGPGVIKPTANVVAVRSGEAASSHLSLQEGSAPRWAVFVWLAGGSVRVGRNMTGGDVVLGPDAPMCEMWGRAFKDVVNEGFAAMDDTGAVLLELGIA